jgi:hypothetical protein
MLGKHVNNSRTAGAMCSTEATKREATDFKAAPMGLSVAAQRTALENGSTNSL